MQRPFFHRRPQIPDTSCLESAVVVRMFFWHLCFLFDPSKRCFGNRLGIEAKVCIQIGARA